MTIIALLWILLLAFFQNVSFSMVSRARNRNSVPYHLITSVFSNGVWFLTFRELVLADFTPIFFLPYTVGTCAGSLVGAKLSAWIERAIDASADGHLKQK